MANDDKRAIISVYTDPYLALQRREAALTTLLHAVRAVAGLYKYDSITNMIEDGMPK